jgi:hypothetical protein
VSGLNILKDFAKINPNEKLPKGNIAKKITSYSEEEYKGVTKFRNGDTIMARITPSLENVNTSYGDILNYDEIGFGSSEFIILNDFIFSRKRLSWERYGEPVWVAQLDIRITQYICLYAKKSVEISFV